VPISRQAAVDVDGAGRTPDHDEDEGDSDPEGMENGDRRRRFVVSFRLSVNFDYTKHQSRPLHLNAGAQFLTF